MDSVNLRKTFLKFFESKGHTVCQSDLLVPSSDPTLLFTTAGMVQFKDLYAGAPLKFSRAATVQKCLRAGGKGSDLENVGRTLRHHTFFEMLGNFSFGDYFKEDAIKWAWEFITDVLDLPKENIYISVYKDDADAYKLWTKKIGIPGRRMAKLGKKDNFWGPAGTTGACGPSSEIYFDLGKERSCGKPDCAVGCDCERYIEFWNLVFPQFFQNEDGSQRELERRGIDTGMGLERLAFITQGVASNYGTDLFAPIIHEIRKYTPYDYSEKNAFGYHVIADHIRALTFALSENILPSNEGRGYVLRRILRRAVRYARKIGIQKPFLYKVAAAVVHVMREPYPELEKSREHVSGIIKNEEERFHMTLDNGMAILDDILERSKAKKLLKGDDVFKLYDTYGFPIDIIRDIATDEGYALDEEGFQKLMVEQKERARASWKGDKLAAETAVYQTIKNREGATHFIGHEEIERDVNVGAIVKEGAEIREARAGDAVEIVLDKTPFYAESGGQAGDGGVLTTDACTVEIADTIKLLDNLWVHKGKVSKGSLKVGDYVTAKVDTDKRRSTARHHTATHILHNVLRRVLGGHVKQAGSLVDQDRLRFDFTHVKALDARELDRVEELVNEEILSNHLVVTTIKSYDEVRKSDVIALFDEKYGETVRVVSVGEFSKELCGGTHIERTGEIGMFKITAETSVAAGVRRIEAVCGTRALAYVKKEEAVIGDLTQLLKAAPAELLPRVQKMIDDARQADKEKAAQGKRDVTSKLDDIVKSAVEVRGTPVVAACLEDVAMDLLREVADGLKLKVKSGVIVLGSVKDGKVSFVCAIADGLVQSGVSAIDIVKKAAAIAGGSGGGRKEMASAGGKDASKVAEAIQAVPKIVDECLSSLVK
ncbi:MAG TPA: alanine--tRNA ligase [bacterium]|nr:alanine--tRNA ligase [bacterium]